MLGIDLHARDADVPARHAEPDRAVAAQGADLEDVAGAGHARAEGEELALRRVAGDVGEALGDGVGEGVGEEGRGVEEVRFGVGVDGGAAGVLLEGGGGENSGGGGHRGEVNLGEGGGNGWRLVD